MLKFAFQGVECLSTVVLEKRHLCTVDSILTVSDNTKSPPRALLYLSLQSLIFQIHEDFFLQEVESKQYRPTRATNEGSETERETESRSRERSFLGVFPAKEILFSTLVEGHQR